MEEIMKQISGWLALLLFLGAMFSGPASAATPVMARSDFQSAMSILWEDHKT